MQVIQLLQHMLPGEVMNGSAQNVGPRKKRSHATPAVAPIARAIRAALAVSATALALSVPAVGLVAGTCSYDTARNTNTCNGGFNQSLFNQRSLAIADANLVPPVDLTVVPGDQLPSSVNAEVAGIDATWASDVSIFIDTGTSIDTSGAFGAMDVGSIDDVTLVDGGDAFADATRIHDVTPPTRSRSAATSASTTTWTARSRWATARSGSATRA